MFFLNYMAKSSIPIVPVMLCTFFAHAQYKTQLFCGCKGTDRRSVKASGYSMLASSGNNWPRGYKTFFMLSLAETKNYPADKC